MADMKGPKPKHEIELEEAEISKLRKIVRARKSPQSKVMRARIVLDAYEHSDMNILNGAISKLQPMPGARIEWYENGDNVGRKARALKTCRAQERRGIFPLKYKHRRPPWLAVFRRKKAYHSVVGVWQKL